MNLVQLLLTVCILSSIFGVVVMSFNLQYGHGGMVNLGIAAYFAAGAYGYAIATIPPPSGVAQYAIGLSLEPWQGFLVAGAAGVILALITGPPALRLRGEYLAITTFAFAEVVRSVLINERRIGNGTLGLAGIARPYSDLFSGWDYNVAFALIAATFALGSLYVFRRLIRSPYGRLLEAISDDETAVLTSGKAVQPVRLAIFLIAALFTAWAGAFYVVYTQFAVPTLFTAAFTFSMIVALVFAGVGSFWRALGGIVVIVLFEEIVRRVPFNTLRAAQIASGLRVAAFGLLLTIFLRWEPFTRMQVFRRFTRPRYGRIAGRSS